MILNVNPIRIAVFGCLVLRFFLLVGGYVGLLAMFSFVIRTLMFQAENSLVRMYRYPDSNPRSQFMTQFLYASTTTYDAGASR